MVPSHLRAGQRRFLTKMMLNEIDGVLGSLEVIPNDNGLMDYMAFDP